jgi:hypothetical protein
MGYAEQIAKDFSLRFFPGAGSAEGILQSWGAGAQNCSWRKLSLISDFLQAFAGSLPALIALAVDPHLVQVIRKYANLSVMAGLDPAIHAASAPFGSHFRFR